MSDVHVHRVQAAWKKNALAQRTQAKVYQLAGRSTKHKGSVSMARRSGRRLKRAASR